MFLCFENFPTNYYYYYYYYVTNFSICNRCNGYIETASGSGSKRGVDCETDGRTEVLNSVNSPTFLQFQLPLLKHNHINSQTQRCVSVFHSLQIDERNHQKVKIVSWTLAANF